MESDEIGMEEVLKQLEEDMQRLGGTEITIRPREPKQVPSQLWMAVMTVPGIKTIVSGTGFSISSALGNLHNDTLRIR